MIDKLSSLKLTNAVDNSVPSLALRNVLIALPRPVPGAPTSPEALNAYTNISRVLIPRLIGSGPKGTTSAGANPTPNGLLDGKDVNAEAVDVLIEVVRCYGPLLSQLEIEAMQEVVLHLLEGDKATSVVKKRSVVAISMLAVYLADDHLTAIIGRLASALSNPKTNQVTRRLYISIMGSMARSIPARFGPHLQQVVPFVLRALSDEELQAHLEKLSDGDDLGLEFNEVREAALVALEAFLAACPQEMRNFTEDVITSTLRFLKYDPNYVVDDDDEMEEDEDEDDEDDDEDEFDADDGFEDDDDDASWKVRRCAAKALYTLISTRASGDLLDNGVLYSQAAPSLIKRIDEREENVRLEVLSALSLLVRKTGEGVHPVDTSFDDFEGEAVGQMPLSRKRRRQSSGGSGSVSKFMAAPGLSSPVLEKAPTHGPRADLTRLTPLVVKAAVKQLKAKAVPTKQAVLSLLDDIVFVQRGGLAEYLPSLIDLVVDAIKPAGSGSVSTSIATSSSNASATPSSLRQTALRLISDIARTHPSATLQPFLPKVVAGVSAAVHDRFYKISSEALRTSEELVKAITPPRSRGAGTKHKGELEKLYEVILERASANDADAEVRQRAIHAIGVLVARTSSPDGTSLLSADKRESALGVLRDRLKNETTRLASVRAVENVAAFATAKGQLDKSWVQDVAVELSAQLRKANRALRGSSIVALRHLLLCGAAKDLVDDVTIQTIMPSLMPAINNSDTHLLGPTLVILASLVQEHSDLVMTEDMVHAICQLLKSHLASIVLDQLLDFVDKVGKSGAGGPLMNGMLLNVSVAGEPAVVGKVIGTLLVVGGSGSTITLESIVGELETSTQAGDERRISLALAILGEAGMRLGAESPLEPALFLKQFRSEPDRVSLAAATALGRAGSGDVPKFLPVILDNMKQGGSMQYLLIQSIKEILQSVSAESSDLRNYATPIWDQLLQAAGNADNKVVSAECIGRLATLDPHDFIPKLQALLKNESQSLRSMAVQAVRYTLPETDETFDAALKAVLVDMLLVMLQDSDMEIRRLAMTTLNSAAHNKPDFILPALNELMPFVFRESVIKQELVREVMLGPFKHTVDDGLEVRKVCAFYNRL